MQHSRIMIGGLAISLLLTASAIGSDTGLQDVLRLSEPGYSNGLWSIQVHVINDEPLLGLDIPIRFGSPGDPVQLVRVDFKDRVRDWNVKHATIDNVNKTVIIGLISEVGSARQNAGLNLSNDGVTIIAELLFNKAEEYVIVTQSFASEHPGHSLTFYYNQIEDGRPEVRELTPGLEKNVEYKAASNVPKQYALSQNFPNPFNPSTSFALSLPEASDYSLRIFNITGQLVKSFSGHLEAGVHTVTWDGKNDQGVAVASGVYFYSAESGEYKETRRMMMLK